MRAKQSWQPSVKTTIRNLRRGPGTRPLYQSLSRGKHGLGHLQRYLLEEMLNKAGDSWEGPILYAHEMPLLIFYAGSQCILLEHFYIHYLTLCYVW